MSDDPNGLNIWTKVDNTILDLVEEKKVPDDSPEEDAEDQRSKRRRLKIALDVFSFPAWTYLILKLFIFDVDRFLVENYLPWAEPVVTFRFFVGLALLVLLVLLFRRYYLGLLYVLFFPLIVLLWKVPRLIYKSKSWIVLFATANVLASIFASFRYNVVTKSVILFSLLLVIANDGGFLVVIGVIGLALSLLLIILRAVRLAIKPSRFLKAQETAIQRVAEAEPVKTLLEVDDELRTPEIIKFDQQQLSKFTLGFSMAILAHRGTLFWAYKLDAYRRSPISLLFGGLTYLWLFLQAVVLLSLINLGIHKLDPSAFSASSASFLAFLNYALTTLYGGETATLQPTSDLALVAKIAGGFIGPTILTTLVLTLVFTYKHGSEDSATREVIDSIKESAQSYEKVLRDEYDVSASEAVNRLEQIGERFVLSFVLQAILFLSSQIPNDPSET